MNITLNVCERLTLICRIILVSYSKAISIFRFIHYVRTFVISLNIFISLVFKKISSGHT